MKILFFFTLAFAVSLMVRAAPTEFTNQVRLDEPIGYWRLNETNETQVAEDASGFGNDGIYSEFGIKLEQLGLNGGDTATSCDGLGDGRISIADGSILNPDHVSMEALVMWFGSNGFQQRILEKSFFLGGEQAQYSLTLLDDGRVRVELRAGGGPSFVTSMSAVPIDETVHLVASYDGLMIRIYINGDLDTEVAASFPGALQDSPTDLGLCNQIERDRPFYGILDEMVVYDKTLSAARIKAHYDALSQGIGGSVTGLQLPLTVICKNKTTGKVVRQLINTTSWDCEAFGLVINSNDKVVMKIKGFTK